MGKLYVANGDDPRHMTRRLLELIQPEAGLEKSALIGLKPNLVVAKSHQSGATTNPAVCEAVIEYFFERGYTNLFIIESAWLAVSTKDAFRVCGYEALAKRHGIELVDVKKDEYITREYGGLKIDISKRALEADCIINLPLIKGHCQTHVTCALKNLKGLIPDREKRRFHAMGLHKPIAYLNKMIRPALTIADGICTDSGFEEGGNPVRRNTMVAGTDSVLVDAYAAALLGYSARSIGYIKIAEEIGVGSADMDGADIGYIGGTGPAVQHTRSVALEAAKARIDAREACSACYGNLVSALIQMGDCGNISVCVGQGFKGEHGGIGCGNCTSGFDFCIKGCPPGADMILEELEKLRGDI
ncbi:MAG: DUF362 domain-containing protein [Eubacteriales bacterium]|nr:DUF362 domain-containing protein [Eubacteriales bacterium]